MSLKSWIAWRGANLVYGALGRILWPRSSAVAIVLKDDSLLAVDTGEYLMLPGGGVEYGESFEETAEREALEETGYRVEVGQRIEESENSVGGREVVFYASLKEEEPVKGSSWEGEPVWIDLNEVSERSWRHNRDVESLVETEEK